ncbi:MAG: HD domain-containing protein [Candidatus Aenigmatarchaeota archaeon]
MSSKNEREKELIDIVKLIKDENLREKTIEVIKNIKISNTNFKKYEKYKIDFSKAYGGPSTFHHAYEGGLIDHTLAVVKISLALAKIFEESYGIVINKDYLIAGAILHDIMKVFCYRKEKGKIESTETMLDHGIWACCELYLRDFPEEVIHIIASHFGPNGANPPQTIEALIVFYADSIDATIESLINRI